MFVANQGVDTGQVELVARLPLLTLLDLQPPSDGFDEVAAGVGLVEVLDHLATGAGRVFGTEGRGEAQGQDDGERKGAESPIHGLNYG